MSDWEHEPIVAAEEEREELRKLIARFGEPWFVRVDVDGEAVTAPPSVVRAMREAIDLLAEGSAVMVVPPPEWVTQRQAASLIGVTETQVSRLLAIHNIERRREGRLSMVRLRDVLKLRHDRPSRGRPRAHPPN